MKKLVYFKELDGIRGIAALMVVLFHFYQGENKYVIIGQTGVTLFFVLSGFLITRIILQTKEEKKFLSSFFIRRTLRIFPLYYLFLIIFFFLIPLITHSPFYPWSKQWYFWIYLQDFAMTFRWPIEGPVHFWSLAVEEHFYLIWPFLLLWLPARFVKGIGYLFIACSVVTSILLAQIGTGGFYFTFSNIDALSMGAILASIEREESDLGFKFRRISFYGFIPFSFLLVLICFVSHANYYQVLKPTVIAFIYAIIIRAVVVFREKRIIKLVLVNPFLQYTGKVSYGMYVYHPLIFILYERYFFHGKGPLFFVLNILITYLIAYLSFSFFESKIMSLKKYFEYGKSK